jgi:predicted PurR-regulated permease PerM
VTRQQLFAAFFFAVFLFLLFQLYRLFYLFITPLIGAVILALTLYPLYTLLLPLFGRRRTLAALLLTSLITSMVIIAIFLFSSLLTSQVVAFYQSMREMIQSGELQQLLSRWQGSYLGEMWRRWQPEIEALNIDLPALALKGGDAVSTFIVGQATGIAKNLFIFIFNFLIMTFILFFLFRDGETLYRTLRDLIPMEPEHKEAIFVRLYETVSAVVQSMVVSAATQGLLAGAGFWLLGIPFAFFLGCASAFLSLLPIGGAAAVWVPCVFYLSLTSQWVKALVLLVYGVIIISGVDNIIKPLIIGGRTRLSTLFLFLGILGGLQAYGFLGLFLGPVLLATIVTFVNIYREEYASPS